MYETVRVVDDIEQIHTALATLGSAGLSTLPDAELLDCLDHTQRLLQAGAVLRCHLLTQIESRDITAAYSTTAAWLRDQLIIDLPEAKQIVTQAGELIRRPEIEQALIRGDINTAQATVICETLTDLPADLDTLTQQAAQDTLVKFADTHTAGTLRRLGARILDHVAPEIAERNERAALEAQEKRAQRRRGLHLAVPHDGSVRINGFLTVEDAAIVNAAFDPLCVPRPGDDRNMAQRRADALIDICDLALRTQSLPDTAGEPAHVVVTIPLAVLGNTNPTDCNAPGPGRSGQPSAHSGNRAEPDTDNRRVQPDRDNRARADRRSQVQIERENGVHVGPDHRVDAGIDHRARLGRDHRSEPLGGWRAVLDTGEHITAEAARRIACHARLIPAVLDSAGQPLDIGHSRRLFTGAVRRALALRDQGCAFPECDKPPRWCHGHHLRHWAQGGPTSLNNGVLLCRVHHRAVHEDGWTARLADDGLPEFLPPAHIDPRQQPQRNLYHRRT